MAIFPFLLIITGHEVMSSLSLEGAKAILHILITGLNYSDRHGLL